MTAGPVVLELHELARRYAAVWKFAVIVPTSVLAPFTDDRPAILVAASVVLAWSVVGFVLLRHQPRVTLAVDVAVAVAVCLIPHSATSSDQAVNGISWVVVVAAITCLSHQLHTTTVVGMTTAVCVTVAFIVGVWLSSPDTAAESLPPAALFVAQSGMCRWLYRMVHRGAEITDELEQQIAAQRQAAAVEAARRADNREYLATLHDTAASTLLMVGKGLAGPAPWLRRQAAADLYVIRDSRRFAATNAVNLVPVLTDLCGDARFSGPPGPVLLPATRPRRSAAP